MSDTFWVMITLMGVLIAGYGFLLVVFGKTNPKAQTNHES